MRAVLPLLMLLLCANSQARIEVLFHPLDPTLEKISQWISQANSTVDIAMYNMDVTQHSPIIQMLQTETLQARIKSQQLKVRVIFEGSGVKEDNAKKMQALENLGVDVRFLDNRIKIHHKFGVFDSALTSDRVITGSANWTLSSQRTYNENIVFLTHEPEVTALYQAEFVRLWTAAKEFGTTGPPSSSDDITPPYKDQDGISVHFNSAKTLQPEKSESEITAHLVRLIDQAQVKLEIATARVRRSTILSALRRAALRGVHVSIIIGQDDYRDLSRRARYLFDIPNLELRVKFYNLRPENYLQAQMHNKYAMIDGKILWTGSFNWSDSSENNYIENALELSGSAAQEVLPDYFKNFENLWDMGRSEYGPLMEKLRKGQHSGCTIPAMVLSVAEVRAMLDFGKECK